MFTSISLQIKLRAPPPLLILQIISYLILSHCPVPSYPLPVPCISIVLTMPLPYRQPSHSSHSFHHYYHHLIAVYLLSQTPLPFLLTIHQLSGILICKFFAPAFYVSCPFSSQCWCKLLRTRKLEKTLLSRSKCLWVLHLYSQHVIRCQQSWYRTRLSVTLKRDSVCAVC